VRPGLGWEAARGCRQCVDRIVAPLFLLLTAPLMLLIAILIRLDSKGPVIFRQVRMGVDRRRGAGQPPRGVDERRIDLCGRPFVFYKFRTMRQDSRQVHPELFTFEYRAEEVDRVRLQEPDDPRLTWIGRILRRTSLDELPNFFNVLKGDMALVGPRPEIPEMSKYYNERDRLKFKVKPGITGHAQVSGRGFLTFRETVDCDVHYVMRRSLREDFRILGKTLGVVLRSVGAF
jgi:lipopolysaccharide/colanic/teichoic acid biosynthesis glycosyltransferase